MNLATPRSQSSLLTLLVLSIFINYIDRGNLSIAGPQVQQELGLNSSQLGLLFSAFFWSYALLQLIGVAGWVADRYAAGAVLAAGFCLWTAATLVTGLLWSFTPLFIVRLALGAGESLAYPCYSRIIANQIPIERRGFANALIDAGSKMGPSLGTFLGGLLLPRLGWRMFFVALGMVSLLWLIPWRKHLVESPRFVTPEPHGYGRIREMLHFRSAWGSFLGHFCGNYYWFFLLTWLPSYLVKERGLSISQMANIGAVAYLAVSAATVSAGWISDRQVARGHSVSLVRKGIVVTGLTVSTSILPVVFLSDVRIAIGLLLFACIAFGTYTSNHWAITQTFAGPTMAGQWTGLQNGFGNLSGIVAAWLTGITVERTGSFQLAFVLAAACALCGALMWGVVAGPVKQAPWSSSFESKC